MRLSFFGANPTNPGMMFCQLLEWGVGPLGCEILSPLSSTRESGEIGIFPASVVSGYTMDPTQGGIFRGASWNNWGEYPQVSGAKHNYVISGTIRDVNGNPIAGVMVKAYRTADDVYIGAWDYSDQNGNYGIGLPDNQQYYLVAYQTSPPLEGTTVNTLVGSL